MYRSDYSKKDNKFYYEGKNSAYETVEISRTQFIIGKLKEGWYRFTNWDGWVGLLFISVLLLIIGSMAYFCIWWNTKECEIFAQLNELEYQYEIIGGCYIKTQSGWTMLDGIVNVFLNK